MVEEGLDGERFGSLVAAARGRGQIAEAAAALRSALALWRELALADISGDLVPRRLAAIGERMRLELALGRHRAISPGMAAVFGSFQIGQPT